MGTFLFQPFICEVGGHSNQKFPKAAGNKIESHLFVGYQRLVEQRGRNDGSTNHQSCPSRVISLRQKLNGKHYGRDNHVKL